METIHHDALMMCFIDALSVVFVTLSVHLYLGSNTKLPSA